MGRSVVLGVSKIPMIWVRSIHTHENRQTDKHARIKVTSHCACLSLGHETWAHFCQCSMVMESPTSKELLSLFGKVEMEN